MATWCAQGHYKVACTWWRQGDVPRMMAMRCAQDEDGRWSGKEVSCMALRMIFLEVWTVKWQHVRCQGDDKVACKVRCPGRRQGEMPRAMMRWYAKSKDKVLSPVWKQGDKPTVKIRCNDHVTKRQHGGVVTRWHVQAKEISWHPRANTDEVIKKLCYGEAQGEGVWCVTWCTQV